jgi:hypothetical protein
MALSVVSNFHDQIAAQERARVMLRIANGTKASSPRILNARREMPLFYSNPLPDNSSGSKNRPIGASKDESGRMNANEIVAMNQAKHHWSHGKGSNGHMEGGVLRHFKYAQDILKRRARDAEDINLASQGLPPNPQPGVELSEIDSRNLELNNLLSSIEESIAQTTLSSLTLSELKNVPRLLIFLSTTFDAGRITELLDYIGELVNDITRQYTDSDTRYADNARRVASFLEQLMDYLDEFVKYVDYSDQDKRIAAVQIAKQIFKLKKSPRAILDEVFVPPAPEPGVFEGVNPMGPPPGMPPPPPPPGGPDDEPDEGGPPQPPRTITIRRRQPEAEPEPEEEEDEEEEEEEEEQPEETPIDRAKRRLKESAERYKEHNAQYLDEFNKIKKEENLSQLNKLADKLIGAVIGEDAFGRIIVKRGASQRDSFTKLYNVIIKRTGWAKAKK